MRIHRTAAGLPRAVASAGAVLLVCGAGAASAADWSFDPKITVNAQSNDNNRLTDIPGQEIKIAGGELDAQLTMRAETPRSSFRLIPRLRSTLYPGDDQEETNDQFLRLALQHKGERSKAALDAKYSRVTTLGRYFPGSTVAGDDQLGEPARGDAVGRSTGRNRQDRLEISPAGAFDMTERVALELRVGHLDVNYDQQVADDREDYSDLYGSAGLRFRLSPTKALSVVAGASRYEPDSGSSRDAHGLHAEWSNQLSETSQVFVRGGASRTEADSMGGGGWNTGFTGGAGVRWSFEVTQIFVDVNRYLDPSSYGRIVERDQLRFKVSRRVGPLTTVTLGARGIRDGQVGNDSSFRQRKYAAGSVGFEWRMTQRFTLGGGYEHVWRKYDGEPDDATSNSLYLGITYEPHRR